jgi:hypothetical protein
MLVFDIELPDVRLETHDGMRQRNALRASSAAA